MKKTSIDNQTAIRSAAEGLAWELASSEEISDDFVGNSRLKMPANWQWFADTYKSTYATLEQAWSELADLKKQVSDLQCKLAAAVAFIFALSAENAALKSELDALKAAPRFLEVQHERN